MPHQPFTLAVTPDGKTLYVTGGANLLTPIRTSTNHPGTVVDADSSLVISATRARTTRNINDPAEARKFGYFPQGESRRSP